MPSDAATDLTRKLLNFYTPAEIASVPAITVEMIEAAKACGFDRSKFDASRKPTPKGAKE